MFHIVSRGNKKQRISENIFFTRTMLNIEIIRQYDFKKSFEVKLFSETPYNDIIMELHLVPMHPLYAMKNKCLFGIRRYFYLQVFNRS